MLEIYARKYSFMRVIAAASKALESSLTYTHTHTHIYVAIYMCVHLYLQYFPYLLNLFNWGAAANALAAAGFRFVGG